MTKSSPQGLMVVISSPSGAGKTTVCQKILQEDKNIVLSISDTTRPPRDNEINGKDYNFITEAEFKLKIKDNSYIEHANVFGNFYGSLHKTVRNIYDEKKDVLFDIDWQGAKQLKNSKYLNIISIFIIPPSRDAIYERLKLRAETSGDDEKSINHRMQSFDTEMNHKNDYDFIVTNDDLSRCVKEIQEIIENKRKN